MFDTYSEKQKEALRSDANTIRREFVALKLKVGKNARAAAEDGLIPDDQLDFNSKLADHIHMAFWSAMISVAASDGPIGRDEADYLNHLFDRNIDPSGYNNTMVASAAEMDDGEAFGTVVSFAIQAGQKEIDDLSEYDPQADPLLRVFDRIGQGLLSCDRHVSTTEVARLSDFTSIAHAKAAEFRRRIDGAIGAATEDATETPETIAAPANEAAPTPIEQCVAELHALVGLSSVKKEVETLINLAKVFALRREKGMPVPPLSFHLVFTGNPGTGKTTVARIIAKVYGSLGLLQTSNLVEVDRSGLVGNFVGQTATKTRKVLDTAKGGILFIDEAYSLSRGTENDYGSEAIEVILKRMEDSRDELVVIVAGYGRNMQAFLQSNPGLRSRFPRTIDFPDYSPEEMATIFERMAAQSGYHLTDQARFELDAFLRDGHVRDEDFANARDARNMFEGVISAQANRIAMLREIDSNMLSEIDVEDVRRVTIG